MLLTDQQIAQRGLARQAPHVGSEYTSVALFHKNSSGCVVRGSGSRDTNHALREPTYVLHVTCPCRRRHYTTFLPTVHVASPCPPLPDRQERLRWPVSVVALSWLTFAAFVLYPAYLLDLEKHVYTPHHSQKSSSVRFFLQCLRTSRSCD